jgi:endonuclease YncB( thermonuclease family)
MKTALFAVLLAFGLPEKVYGQVIDRSDSIAVFVTKVADGDTFYCTSCDTCNDEVKVRVLNLDTYEKIRSERLRDQAERMNIAEQRAMQLGKQATDAATSLLLGKTVTLHRGNKREPRYDKYGRLLRYVLLSDGEDYSALMKLKGYNVKR